MTHSETGSEDKLVIRLESLGDCKVLAEQIASCVKTPFVICLVGTLGAGKTQWTRFFVEAFGVQREAISSPTFVLVHRYDCATTIYHLDAYRVGDEDELLELGIEEFFEDDAITIVEWADRFPHTMPRNALWLHFEIPLDNPHARVVEVKSKSAATWNRVRDRIEKR